MKPLIERLALGVTMIPEAVAGVDEDEARWKPDSGAWSIVEIVNHLADEEVEDFRTRLDLLLHMPARDWPGIDPESAAKERRYQERDPDESVSRFVREREESLRWLRRLKNPKWDNARSHPAAGELRAGDILASWVAHDLLHLRQIAKRRFEYTQRLAEPYRTEYAGTWSP